MSASVKRLDLLHPELTALAFSDDVADQDVATLCQPVERAAHVLAEQRIAAAQMMVEKRKRGANCKGMQPQRHFRQFDSHRIEVHAVDTALQDHAADDIAVVELALGHWPIVFLRPFSMRERIVAMRAISGDS